MMETINPQNPPKPCEVFDLIGGTSTGGLIAIMLGRLEMGIQEAIDAYLEFSTSIFRPKRKKVALLARVADVLKTTGRFDTENFEKCIKRIVNERLGDENALLIQDGNSTCKVFVCAIRRENAQPVFLRSYHSSHGHEVSCTIWEACRATAAATSLFEPIKIGQFNEEFVDGATGFNNPVNEVLLEARDLWPETILSSNVACLVSIGTGLRSNSSFGPSVMQVGRTLLRIAVETEKTAERFHRAYPTLVSENKYFRFNVQKGARRCWTS
ncbi:FabD/lysophospholipase-like protein [Cadophora sp. DSE1049]|nr:FabD/lysophospholipase-like protein [Cadophora sp. DSE1049]